MNLFRKILLVSLLVIFRVYCADHTYCTLRFPMSANGETIKRSAAEKLNLPMENLVMVELKSVGKLDHFYSDFFYFAK